MADEKTVSASEFLKSIGASFPAPEKKPSPASGQPVSADQFLSDLGIGTEKKKSTPSESSVGQSQPSAPVKPPAATVKAVKGQAVSVPTFIDDLKADSDFFLDYQQPTSLDNTEVKKLVGVRANLPDLKKPEYVSPTRDEFKGDIAPRFEPETEQLNTESQYNLRPAAQIVEEALINDPGYYSMINSIPLAGPVIASVMKHNADMAGDEFRIAGSNSGLVNNAVKGVISGTADHLQFIDDAAKLTYENLAELMPSLKKDTKEVSLVKSDAEEPTQFKTMFGKAADYLKSRDAEWKEMPVFGSDRVGDLTTSLGEFVPMIVALKAIPNAGVAGKLLPRFPMYMGLTSGLSTYSAAREQGMDVNDATREGARAFVPGAMTGAAFELFGYKAGNLAKIAQSAFKSPLISASTAVGANAAGFALTDYMSTELQGGEGTKEQALHSFLLGALLGADGLRKGAAGEIAVALSERAMKNYMNSDPLAFSKTSRDEILANTEKAREKAIDLRDKAEKTEDEVEKNKLIIAAGTIDAIADVAVVGDIVSKNVKAVKELIDNDPTLTPELKERWKGHVDKTAAVTDPLYGPSQKIGKEILSVQREIDAIAGNSALDPAVKAAKVAPLEARVKELNAGLQELYNPKSQQATKVIQSEDVKIVAPKTAEEYESALVDVVGHTPEVAKAHRALADLAAKQWAKENGRDAKDWYDTTFAAIQNEASYVAMKAKELEASGVSKKDALKQAQEKAFDMTQSSRGTISFTQEGKAIISAFKDANTSTIAHEALGHTYMERRMREAANGSDFSKRIIEAVLGEYNAEKGTKHTYEDLIKEDRTYTDENTADGKEPIYVGIHEKFATGFEAYLRDGQKAKTKGLQKVFDDFKDWMLEIYPVVSENMKVSKGMTELYDQMLGKVPEKKVVEKPVVEKKEVAAPKEEKPIEEKEVPVPDEVQNPTETVKAEKEPAVSDVRQDIKKRVSAGELTSTQADFLIGAVDRSGVTDFNVDNVIATAGIIAKIDKSKSIEIEHIAEAAHYEINKNDPSFGRVTFDHFLGKTGFAAIDRMKEVGLLPSDGEKDLLILKEYNDKLFALKLNSESSELLKTYLERTAPTDRNAVARTAIKDAIKLLDNIKNSDPPQLKNNGKGVSEHDLQVVKVADQIHKAITEKDGVTDEVKSESKDTTDIDTVTKKYGWTYTVRPNGDIALSNRKAKEVAVVSQKGGKYVIKDTSGNRILSGNKSLSGGIEQAIRDYFYGKPEPEVGKEPVKSESKEPVPTPEKKAPAKATTIPDLQEQFAAGKITKKEYDIQAEAIRKNKVPAKKETPKQEVERLYEEWDKVDALPEGKEKEAKMNDLRVQLSDAKRRMGVKPTELSQPKEQEIEFRGEKMKVRLPEGVRVSDIGFYSTVEKALTGIQQGKGTPEQFKKMLLNNGAKQAELDWMGWDDLAGKKSLTKQEVQDWIDQNRIEVKEVVLGGTEWNSVGDNKWERKIDNVSTSGNRRTVGKIKIIKQGDFYYGTDSKSNFTMSFKSLDEAKSHYDNIEGLKGDTKYSQYQLPGGENYKEVLLTMPATPIVKSWKASEIGNTGRYVVTNDKNEFARAGRDILEYPNRQDAEYAAKQRNEYKEYSDKDFKSSHFDEPNIVAHVRFNERTDTNGQRVLFIEEIQSDWAQRGKKEGFKTKATELPEGTTIYKNEFGLYNIANNGIDRYSDLPTEQAAKEKVLNAIDAVDTRIPSMPFHKTDQWVNLALRRMIRYAAENGFDRIAWTTGEQQAERYDLSKQVDIILWSKNTDGSIDITATKGGAPVIEETVSSVKDVEPLIGKELARKIQMDIDGKRLVDVKSLNDNEVQSYNYLKSLKKGGHVLSPTQSRNLLTYEQRINNIGLENKQILVDSEKRYSGEFSGNNLKVGGEGMKTFYDQIIPARANELGKKFGANVEEIATGEKSSEYEGVGLSDIKRYSEQVGKNKLFLAQSLPITPEMLSSALTGMPLFQKKPQRLTKAEKDLQEIERLDIQKDIDKRYADLAKKVAGSETINMNYLRGLKTKLHNIILGAPVRGQEKVAGKTTDKAGSGIAKLIGRGQGSKNDWARMAAKATESVFRGISREMMDVRRWEQFLGDKNLVQEDMARWQKAINKIVDNNPQSMVRIHKVMDPEFYKKKTYDEFVDWLRDGYTERDNLDAFNNFSPETLQKMYEKMSEAAGWNDPNWKDTTIKDLTPDEVKVHDLTRMVLDLVHDISYATGHIEKPTYEKYKGKYVPRMYDKYEIHDPYAEKVNNLKDSAVPKSARDLINRMNLGIFQHREQETAWNHLHIIKDPVYMAAKRMSQVMINKAIGDYASSIAKNHPEWLLPKTEPPRAGYVVMGKGYGALSGRSLRSDIAEDFLGLQFQNQMLDSFYTAFKMYANSAPRTYLKKWRTVYNAGVNLGNYTGNVVFASLLGINPVRYMANQPYAWKQLTSHGSMYRLLVKEGVIDGKANMEELQRSSELFKSLLDADSPNGVRGAIAKMGRADTWWTNFYQNVDKAAKITAFKSLIDMGLDPAIAANRVAEGFQNFNRVGKLYDIYSKTPFIGAPFAKFQGDVVRIMRQSATTRPLNLVTTIGTLYALSQWASVQSGENDEDKAIREGRRNAPMIPFSDISLEFKIGNQALNLARFIMPFYVLGSGEDDAGLSQLAEKLVPFNVPFKDSGDRGLVDMNKMLSRDILFAPIVNLANDEDFFGNPILDPKVTDYDKKSFLDWHTKALNGTRFAARGYIPFFAMVDDILTVAKTGEDRYGRKKTPGLAIARYLGWNSQVFDDERYQKTVERGLTKYVKELEYLVGEQGEWKKKYEVPDKNGKTISFQEYTERSANIEAAKAKAVEAAIEQMNKNMGRLPRDVVEGLINKELRSYKSTVKEMLKIIGSGPSTPLSGEGTSPASGEGTQSLSGEGTTGIGE